MYSCLEVSSKSVGILANVYPILRLDLAVRSIFWQLTHPCPQSQAATKSRVKPGMLLTGTQFFAVSVACFSFCCTVSCSWVTINNVHLWARIGCTPVFYAFAAAATMGSLDSQASDDTSSELESGFESDPQNECDEECELPWWNIMLPHLLTKLILWLGMLLVIKVIL